MNKEIDLIKEKIDIVDFISQYIKLEPAGKNFKALCPFHSEKTPSFIVSPEKQIWHCFGACNEGGDVIKFLMKYSNLDFYEALQFLAEKAGIELKKINPQQQREIGVLFELNEKANEFFVKNLKKNENVLNYLIKERGLEEETISKFLIGYAPGGDLLTTYLLNLGFDLKDILKSGLAVKNKKGLYVDRFQKRISFPFLNSNGKVVGFMCRILKELENNSDFAKYLNSPENIIFNKSKLLYGFYQTKDYIVKTQSVFLVEGPFDLLAAWQSGIKQVVAVSGSALTVEHLQILRRIVNKIYLSFDNDAAGLKALENAFRLISPFDFEVKVVDLKHFKDPAETILVDKNFLKEAFLSAAYFFDYLFNYFFNKDLDFYQKKEITRKLLTLIKLLKSPLEQENWLKKLADILKVETSVLIEEFNLIKTKKTKVEYSFLSNKINEKNRYDLIFEKILLFLVYDERFYNKLKEIKAYFLRELDEKSLNLDYLKLKATYEFSGKNFDVLNEEFEKLVLNLKLEFLKIKREEILLKIKEAEKEQNENKLDNLIKMFHDITIELNALTKK